jgi:hypothetical protein
MIRMNGRFLDFLNSQHCPKQVSSLEPKLARIIDAGFTVVDGCFLLTALADVTTNATEDSFPDKTGYECFINHIHIEDHVTENFFAESVVFTSALLRKWNDTNCEGHLVVIAALGIDEGTIRCHLKRSNESWLANDLDRFEQAILEISSNDLMFFDLLNNWPHTKPKA